MEVEEQEAPGSPSGPRSPTNRSGRVAMMFWYDHDVSGWGWFAMSAGMVLFWALIITAVVLLIRALYTPHEHTHAPPPTAPTPTPEDILRERLARGEIDEEEYRRRLSTLRADPLKKT